MVAVLRVLALFSTAGLLAACGDSSPEPSAQTYSVGGTTSGLSGSVELQINNADGVTLSSDGNFVFTTALATGSAFSVTVATQPAGQNCTVANNAGTIGSSAISNVAVNCSSNAFTVGGSVSGLSGSVVLQNNGQDDLSIAANGAFEFATALPVGTAYSISQASLQFPGQTCTLANATGTVNSNVTDITLTCVPPETVVCNGDLDKTYNISTFAGSGTGVHAGMGGPATAAKIGGVRGLTVDGAGNLYIASLSNNRIYKVDQASNVISSFAGTGAYGSGGDGGLASAAQVSQVWGLNINGTGDIYLSDPGSNSVRRIDATTGIITTIAGTSGLGGNTGDGGLATAALINQPVDMEFDSDGNIYIADWANHVVRKIDADTGIITSIAGTITTNGNSGDGGLATSALLNHPFGLGFDASGNLYVSEWTNYTVRKIDKATGVISKVAGTTNSAGTTGDGGLATSAALSSNPSDIMLDGVGNLIIADASNHVIRLVEAATGNIKTIAGSMGVSGYSGDVGAATAATLFQPYSLACRDGTIFVSDSGNSVVRALTVAP